MNLVTHCYSCRRTYIAVPEGIGDPLLKTIGNSGPFTCLTAGCRGKLAVMTGDQIATAFTVSAANIPMPAKEFYRAIHGMGRSRLTVESASSALTGKTIASIVGAEVGDPARVILDKIIFTDGTVANFAYSTAGACLYKIEEPDDGNSRLRDKQDTGNNSADREETRRSSAEVEQ